MIVKTATEADEASVIDTLTLAFAADPAVRWVSVSLLLRLPILMTSDLSYTGLPRPHL